jgi:hypothetical protein
MTETMQELNVTLPKNMVKYLEAMSEYTAESISEMIEELVFNHFIRHFEITNNEHRPGLMSVPRKPFPNYTAEREFLQRELAAWPENSIEYQMLQSRLRIIQDRLDLQPATEPPPEQKHKKGAKCFLCGATMNVIADTLNYCSQACPKCGFTQSASDN